MSDNGGGFFAPWRNESLAICFSILILLVALTSPFSSRNRSHSNSFSANHFWSSSLTSRQLRPLHCPTKLASIVLSSQERFQWINRNVQVLLGLNIGALRNKEITGISNVTDKKQRRVNRACLLSTPLTIREIHHSQQIDIAVGRKTGTTQASLEIKKNPFWLKLIYFFTTKRTVVQWPTIELNVEGALGEHTILIYWHSYCSADGRRVPIPGVPHSIKCQLAPTFSPRH